MDKYSAHDRGFVVSTPGKIIINFYGQKYLTQSPMGYGIQILAKTTLIPTIFH